MECVDNTRETEDISKPYEVESSLLTLETSVQLPEADYVTIVDAEMLGPITMTSVPIANANIGNVDDQVQVTEDVVGVELDTDNINANIVGVELKDVTVTNAAQTQEGTTSNTEGRSFEFVVNSKLANSGAADSEAMELDVEVAITEKIGKQTNISSTEGDTEITSYYWNYELNAKENPTCLAVTAKTEFQNVDYIRGCKWAPDGSCLLTNSNDSYMRIFNLPASLYGVQDWNSLDENDESWNSALKIKEGGLVYDYCWYPQMSSMDPVTSCFLTTASNGPVHLWDAFTGKLRASYLGYNQVDEVTAAYSVAFDPTGEKIYCGYEKYIKIFDIGRPGRQCIERKLKNKDFPSLSQTGIISCIAISSSRPSLYACGSFRNTIGLYLEDGTVLCNLEGHFGGLTHLKFSQDGTKLFSGSRKDSRLISWDIRNLGDKYQILNREVATNQRIYFDTTMDDRFLVSGGTDGKILIWDLLTDSSNGCATQQFELSSDCVNGVSFNPFIPVLATATGQRYFKEVADDSSDEIFVESSLIGRKRCDVRLWKFL